MFCTIFELNLIITCIRLIMNSIHKVNCIDLCNDKQHWLLKRRLNMVKIRNHKNIEYGEL